MQIKINKNGNRKFGFYKESEIKISGLSTENVNEMFVDSKILIVANFLRLKWGKTKINSCGRTVLYNASVGGAKSSKHLILPNTPVYAMDFKTLEIPRTEQQQIVMDNLKTLRLLGVRGIGFYTWGVHIDVRPQNEMSAWGMSADKIVQIKNTKPFFNF